MPIAAIALGSNLPSPCGEPADNLHAAIRRLAALGNVAVVSSFRTTSPVGYLNQPDFVNGAALLETELAPLELLRALLSIEQAMGRDRAASLPAKGPRILDLDLLLYTTAADAASAAGATGSAGAVLTSPELTLPHPALHERRFVLEPLAEIAPEWEHPTLRLTMRQLLQRCAA